METTITQKAAEIGISQGFLINLLACRRHPQWSGARKLAKVFNTDPNFWMKGESTSKERWAAFNRAAATNNTQTNRKGFELIWQSSNPRRISK